MKSYFTPKEVVRVIGISYRQIQYWDRTRFIQPSHKRREKYRLYTFADLLRLRIAKSLRDVNISIQKLRRIVTAVPDLLVQASVPLRQVSFLIDTGNDVAKPSVIMFDGSVFANAQARLKFVLVSGINLAADVEREWPDELAYDFKETA